MGQDGHVEAVVAGNARNAVPDHDAEVYAGYNRPGA